MFEHHWEPAEATIVETRALTNWSGSSENTGGPAQSTPYEYIADVRPPGQPEFRATFRDPYIRGHMRHPSQGQVVNVLFNPKSREVKLAAAEWKISPGEQQHEENQSWQETADAPPRSAPPRASAASRASE